MKKLAADVYAHPENYPELDQKKEKKLCYYRVATHGAIPFFSPDIIPFIEKRLGIPPKISQGEKDDWKSKYEKLKQFKIKSSKPYSDDLLGFAARQLLKDPDEVINAQTGKTLKQAIKRARMDTGTEAAFFHKDIDRYLLNHWMDHKPIGEEDKWLTGNRLLIRCGCTPHKAENISLAMCQEATQTILQEMRNQHPEQIKRLVCHAVPPAYYIHEDALATGLLTQEMIIERAKHIQSQPDRQKMRLR